MALKTKNTSSSLNTSVNRESGSQETTSPIEVLPSPTDVGEVQTLAYELSKTYRNYVDHYRQSRKLTPPEADTELQKDIGNLSMDDTGLSRAFADWPPQESSWFQLEMLAEKDPSAMVQTWRNINQAALDQLHTGHSAALAVAPVGGDTPWERAQFLALRASMIYEWQPRGGIELTLIDIMAQAQTCYLRWLRVMLEATAQQAEHTKSIYSKKAVTEPPRLTDAQAVEQAAAMVDRFNRLYLRTLRQLRDLRRYAPTVMIQNADQVNIGGQQIDTSLSG